MNALIVNSANNWSIEHVPKPIPEMNELLIKVVACGICGTDLHTIQGSNPTVNFPITPGHEFGGIVEMVGSASSKFKIGNRVVVNPARSCGQCEFCDSGRENLCPLKGGYGAKFPGGFEEFVCVLESSCELVSEHLGWKMALLAEPLACVLTGLKKLQNLENKDVLVVGGGPIGALFCYVLENMCGSVTLVEPVKERRDLISKVLSYVKVKENINLLHQKWDVVIEATGIAKVIEDSFNFVQSGGQFLIMGVTKPSDKVSFAPSVINRWEISILGSFSINDTFSDAIRILSKSSRNLDLFITDVITLDNFENALEKVKNKAEMKILIKCSEEFAYE